VPQKEWWRGAGHQRVQGGRAAEIGCRVVAQLLSDTLGGDGEGGQRQRA
jgi:hypothetical protein